MTMPEQDQTTSNSNQKEKSDLRRCVFSSIEEKSLEPKAKCWFTFRRIAIWCLWIATITIGAVTAAVLLFVARFQQYALYEVTHRDGLSFVVAVLPVIWIILFIAAVVVAYFELRHTPQGYKHSFWKIFGGTFVAVILIGITFELVNVGQMVDKKLGVMSEMYVSQEAKETEMWQKPSEGRLIGVSGPESFVDKSGRDWEVSEVELMSHETELLRSGKEVKLYGTSTEDGLFVACGVLPSLGAAASRRELRDSRQEFVKKVKEYRALARAELVSENGTNTKPCRKLPIYNRR